MLNRIYKEFRCLKRTDLIKAMANCLPMETIRTGCQVVSIELDPITQYRQLVLSNGSILQAKVCLVENKTVTFSPFNLLVCSIQIIKSEKMECYRSFSQVFYVFGLYNSKFLARARNQ